MIDKLIFFKIIHIQNNCISIKIIANLCESPNPYNDKKNSVYLEMTPPPQGIITNNNLFIEYIHGKEY